MKVFSYTCFALLTALAMTSAALAGYVDTGEYTVEPDGWSVGDPNSTHMIYDSLLFPMPDVNVTNPAGLAVPTISVNSPGFPIGSGDFYSWGGNYSAQSDIYNHNTGGTDGTHVIVQTTATVNPNPSEGGPASVFYDTLEIVDHSGSAITGGANGDSLVNADLVAKGRVSSGHGGGSVDLEVRIWEFFLPGYTDDFRVQWGEIIHSCFDQLRVDSMIASAEFPATQFTFTAIPEPASIALAVLLGLGLTVVGLRKHWG